MYIWQTATVRPISPSSFSASSLSLCTCIQRILTDNFYLLRERPKNPHIMWSHELHEPSTYFCHCPRRSDVYSAAEGKLRCRNVDKHTKGVAVWLLGLSLTNDDVAVLFRRRNLQRAPQLFGYEAGWVMLPSIPCVRVCVYVCESKISKEHWDFCFISRDRVSHLLVQTVLYPSISMKQLSVLVLCHHFQ